MKLHTYLTRRMHVTGPVIANQLILFNALLKYNTFINSLEKQDPFSCQKHRVSVEPLVVITVQKIICSFHASIRLHVCITFLCSVSY